MGDIAAQDKEEQEAQLTQIKKQVAQKLDSVFFDDELDQLKTMITMLSDVMSETSTSKDQIEKLKNNQKAATKKSEGGGGGSMRMSKEK